MRLVRDHANYLFARFNGWFTSRGGVFQTVGVTALIVALEATHVLNDPHGFWLLYWLTIYSAITQPALAASTRYNEAQLEAVLGKLRHADENNAALLDRIVVLLEAMVDERG